MRFASGWFDISIAALSKTVALRNARVLVTLHAFREMEFLGIVIVTKGARLVGRAVEPVLGEEDQRLDLVNIDDGSYEDVEGGCARRSALASPRVARARPGTRVSGSGAPG